MSAPTTAGGGRSRACFDRAARRRPGAPRRVTAARRRAARPADSEESDGRRPPRPGLGPQSACSRSLPPWWAASGQAGGLPPPAHAGRAGAARLAPGPADSRLGTDRKWHGPRRPRPRSESPRARSAGPLADAGAADARSRRLAALLGGSCACGPGGPDSDRAAAPRGARAWAARPSGPASPSQPGSSSGDTDPQCYKSRDLARRPYRIRDRRRRVGDSLGGLSPLAGGDVPK